MIRGGAARLGAASVVALLALLLVGVATGRAADPVQRKMPAKVVVVTFASGSLCVTGAELQFAAVKGALGYAVEYTDSGRKVGPQPVSEFVDDKSRDKPGKVPAGMLRAGIAGFWGDAPCGDRSEGEAGYAERFKGPAAVYVTVPANYKPKGSLAVSVSAPVAGAGVGDTVPVSVTVTAGELPVSGISLGRGLSAGGAAAEIVGRPSGASGFSLGAAASRTFVYRVKALAAGAVALSASAGGRTKTGSVSGRGADTLRVSKVGLALTLSTDPAVVRLDVDETGKAIPKDVTVTVKLTNTGNAPLENVSLQSVQPVPVVDGQRLDQLALPAGSLPASLGTLPPKSPVTRQFTLRVTGDGRYELRALALFASPSGGRGTVAEVGGRFEAIVPALYFAPRLKPDNIEQRDGSPWVVGGKTYYIAATLKNLSAWRTLCVAPLAPRLGQNAAATGLVDIADRSFRDLGGPFAGKVKPGEDVLLLMYVDTAAAGPTRSTVELEPEAADIEPGDDCNQRTFAAGKKLKPADKEIPEPGADFLVRVDTSVIPPPGRRGGAVLNFFGGFTMNVFVDTVRAPLDLLALCRAYWDAEQEFHKQYPLAPRGSFVIFKEAQAIAVAADVYASYWRVATEQEKGNIFRGAGRALGEVTNRFYVDSTAFVREAAEPFMQKLEKAYANGDDAELGFLWGQVAGSAAQQAVVGMFTKLLGARIVSDSARLERAALAGGKEWEAAEAAKALAGEAAAATKIAKKTVPPGTLLELAEKLGVWGIDARTDELLTKIAKKYDILIGVRDRAIESVRKLELGSVWKHENLKPKNVNQIDIDWLGFRKGDLAEVRFRTYTDSQVAEITERVRTAPGLTAEQRVAILDRFETRLHEEGYLDSIRGYSRQGEINVGFNYRDNGLDKATTRQIRKFRLESDQAGKIGDVSAGGEYFTPLQENLDLYRLRKGGALPPNCRRMLQSVLCTVTGDVDGVYVTRVDGRQIAPEVLVKVYNELADAGWQHPETLTWINRSGEFVFGAKADILKTMEVGGSALVEYAPDGRSRAVFLNIRQSTLLSNKDYRLRTVGGYVDAMGE